MYISIFSINIQTDLPEPNTVDPDQTAPSSLIQRGANSFFFRVDPFQKGDKTILPLKPVLWLPVSVSILLNFYLLLNCILGTITFSHILASVAGSSNRLLYDGLSATDARNWMALLTS